MKIDKNDQLILGVTGASGSCAAQILIRRSIWPVSVIMSKWGKIVMKHESVREDYIFSNASCVFNNDDLFAPLSSGSVATIGMVILPCSAKTLGQIASGIGETLISRAAHCHLKERRRLVLCLRESPLTSIDIMNMKRVEESGGIIMPLSPPFFMFAKSNPEEVSMIDLLCAFVDRVLAIFGQKSEKVWGDLS